MFYKCHKINPNRGGLYIDSPDWIKNKKATINPINKKDNKCFQYAATVVLNHEEIGKRAERITKVKPFVNKCKWERINFHQKKDDWEKFEKIVSIVVIPLEQKTNLNCIKAYVKIKIFAKQLCFLKALTY